MKSHAVINFDGAGTRTPATATPSYCEHASARRIRVYLPYADANTLRLRAAQAAASPDTHVSWLYPVPGGWGFTMCGECRSRERKSA